MDRLIFLIGTPFSGSTALGKILGVSGASYVGELDRLPVFGMNQYPTRACEMCKSLSQSCPVYSDDFLSVLSCLDLGSETYDSLSKHLKSSILVDGSKHVAWLRHVVPRLSDLDKSNTIAIVTVRHPVLWMISHLRADPHCPPFRAAEIWRDTYTDALRTLSRLNIPFIVLRNESFRHDHIKYMKAIERFCCVEIKPKFEYDVSASHSIGGNSGLENRVRDAGLLCVTPVEPTLPRDFEELRAVCFDTPGLVTLASTAFGYNFNHPF